MKAFGFSLTLSDLEHALWWDSDQHQQAKARGWEKGATRDWEPPKPEKDQPKSPGVL